MLRYRVPTYSLKNTKTNEIEELFMSISKMEELVKSGEYTVVITTPPGDLGHRDGILSKTDNGWKEMLGRIKRNSGRGNTIKL